MKKIYILPNLFTTASLFCGLLAIINIFDGHYELACSLILISIVMDALDGRIARLTRTQSAFGLNYDSLSDLVAFGVAPAMLIFIWLRAMTDSSSYRVATGVSLLFAICGALRLARFNVQVIREERRKFVGLPIPAAAGTVVATFLALWRSRFLMEWQDSFIIRFLPLVFIGLSCLMVSNVTYPSWKRIDLVGRKPFDYLVLIIIVICLIIALWQMRAMMLFLGFWSYVLWGFLGALVHSHRRNEEALPQTTPEER